MSKDNGGPAFPVSDVMALEPRTTAEMVSLAHGMTLRDYFAAKALNGLCADGSTAGRKKTDLVAECYEIADAMLLERAK